MNIPNKTSKPWGKFSIGTHPAITDSIITYGHRFMTVRTFVCANKVCKKWHKATRNCPIRKELAHFRLLFTPLFKRFITGLNTIDTTTITKYQTMYIPNPDNYFYASYTISQSQYERAMIRRAAIISLESFGHYHCSNTTMKKMDRQLLLQASLIISQYYSLPFIKKVTDIYSSELPIFPPEKNEYLIISIKDLSKKIDNIKRDKALLNALNTIKNLIIKHSILPIDNVCTKLNNTNTFTYDTYNNLTLYTSVILIIFIILFLISR